MNKVYTNGKLLTRLRADLSRYVADTGTKVSQNLIALCLAVLIVWNRITVHWLYENAPQLLGARCLNSYYYGLEEAVRSEPEEPAWKQGMRKVLRDIETVMPPQAGDAPLLLAVDDTLIEKHGEHFDDVGINFDHAAHDGRTYKNSHVFVSVTAIAPVEMAADGKAVYASFPLGYALWRKDDERSKLDIAREIIAEALLYIGGSRRIILLCDSWYSKRPLTSLLDTDPRLAMICAVRRDTVMYKLPPKNRKKGPGRPRKYGQKIKADAIPLKSDAAPTYKAGSRQVLTRIFGNRTVLAIATKSSKKEAVRLFMCTLTSEELHELNRLIQLNLPGEEAVAGSIAKPLEAEDIALAVYHYRWSIEVGYMEQKDYWDLGGYMIRRRCGFERLINLMTGAYAEMKLLPYTCESCREWRGLSAQDIRSRASDIIRKELFLETLIPEIVQIFRTAQNDKNSTEQLERLLWTRLDDFPKAS